MPNRMHKPIYIYMAKCAKRTYQHRLINSKLYLSRRVYRLLMILISDIQYLGHSRCSQWRRNHMGPEGARTCPPPTLQSWGGATCSCTLGKTSNWRTIYYNIFDLRRHNSLQAARQRRRNNYSEKKLSGSPQADMAGVHFIYLGYLYFNKNVYKLTSWGNTITIKILTLLWNCFTRLCSCFLSHFLQVSELPVEL